MNRLAFAVMLGSVLAGTAAADKPASLDHYKAGKRAYAAGDFQAAHDEFERAYHEFPAPEYLHDIAQTLRRLDRCTEAIEYFERYLADVPTAGNRPAVEGQIAALRAQCPATPIATSPPPAPAPAPVPPPATIAPPPRVAIAPVHEPAEPAIVAIEPMPAIGSRWLAQATGGVMLLGAGPVVMPPLAQLRVGGSYRVLESLRVGAALALARLPYDDVGHGTAWLGGPELTLEGEYPLAPRIAIVAGAGLGTRTVWGLGMGNPFVAGGQASGAITMFALRGEVGVRWRVQERTSVRVLPLAYEYSPRRAPLAADIGSLRGFAMLAGIDVSL